MLVTKFYSSMFSNETYNVIMTCDHMVIVFRTVFCVSNSHESALRVQVLFMNHDELLTVGENFQGLWGL